MSTKRNDQLLAYMSGTRCRRTLRCSEKLFYQISYVIAEEFAQRMISQCTVMSKSSRHAGTFQTVMGHHLMEQLAFI